MSHDAESDDDLDERLARVFEERGIPQPPPRATPRPRPAAATPVATITPPAAPAPVAPRRLEESQKPAVTVVPRRSGGREKTILLAMLGTLAGAFVGVLSMKLLVPRPPNGAGPDIHLETAGSGLDIVDPPALTGIPPTTPIPPDPFRSLAVPADPLEVDVSPDAPAEQPDASRFETVASAGEEPLAEGRYGRHAADNRLTTTAPPDLAPVPTDRLPPASSFGSNPLREAGEAVAPRGRAAAPPADDPYGVPGAGVIPTAATGPLEPFNAAASPGGYVVREGDTWWSLAETTYGDGRLYKALFAWNRTIDSRVSLVPGTRLELPREEQLRAAWGRLVPIGAP